jgi:uncharacterized protein
MEDRLLAWRWAEDAFNADSLLASAVCGTGLDTTPYPGDISVDRLSRIFGDIACLPGNGTSRCRRGCSW